MTGPLLKYPPTSRIVALAWARSVMPAEVHVDRTTPADADVTQQMRDNGIVVMRGIVGGTPDRDVPMRAPVVSYRAWFPPTKDAELVQTNAAELLGNQLLQAVYEHPNTKPRYDLSGYGSYRPAFINSLIPVSELREIPDDPGNWAGFDVDVLINWSET